MKEYFFRITRLSFGIVLFALGVTIKIRANIGYAPWDVFHAGLSKVTGISFGKIAIIVGCIIVIVILALGEKIGIGTLFNMTFIGLFIDLFLSIDLIPLAPNFVTGLVMMLAGLITISIASYFYIGAGFGTGPRDGLMVVLAKKTGLKIGICRGIVELCATLAGWRLGGMLGLGTVLYVIAVSFCIQLTFSLLKFDPKKIRHENLADTARNIGLKFKTSS